MAAEYKVLRINEMVEPDEVKGIQYVYRHTIKTKGGAIFTVKIPEKDFTAEKVAPILLKKAQEVDKILAL